MILRIFFKIINNNYSDSKTILKEKTRSQVFQWFFIYRFLLGIEMFQLPFF